MVAALQDVDITQRMAQGATFFDIGETTAISYRPALQFIISIVAVLLGIIAWVRLTADAIRQDGLLRWLLLVVWSWLGAAGVFGAMVGATWLLRWGREVYHPWYARPGRLFLLLIAIGVTTGWSVTRLGRWLPRRAHPTRHTSLTWTMTLPAWIGFAGTGDVVRAVGGLFVDAPAARGRRAARADSATA